MIFRQIRTNQRKYTVL